MRAMIWGLTCGAVIWLSGFVIYEWQFWAILIALNIGAAISWS